MDKLAEYLVSVLHKVGDALPKATEYALSVTALGCEYNLIQFFLCLLFGLILSPIVYLLLVKRSRYIDEYGEYESAWWGIGSIIVAVGVGVFSLLLVLSGIYGLADLWKWTCLYHPDLYMVHRIMGN